MPDSPSILVIEDEAPIRKFLRAALVGEGYRVAEAETGAQGVRAAAAGPPDLIVLDLGLPDLDGRAVLVQLRQWYAGPIVILSARDQEQQKIEALDGGADDYLSKPFSIGELLARLRVALRHSARVAKEGEVSGFRSGDLHVDLAARRVTVGPQEVHLTPIEYRLLVALVRHAGKVLTHRHLLKEVWGPDAVMETHYLRVYMAQLRRKIEADPARPQYLITEPGVGYRLVEI